MLRSPFSPVFFLHILSSDVIHNMDLHHGVWDEQVVLEAIWSVDVHSQHEAVVKRWPLWSFSVSFTLFFDNWKMGNWNQHQSTYIILTLKGSFADNKHPVTMLFLRLFLLSLGFSFVFHISVLVSTFIMIPSGPKCIESSKCCSKL